MPNATLSLQFSATNHGSALRVLSQQPPWRVIRAFPNANGEALVHLHNVSGGVLAGDQLRLRAEVLPEAQAQITTVGATRVYRHRTAATSASQSTVIEVGEGALLEYLPDPLIPFAGSRFSQECEVCLSAGAGLIWWETLSSGRVAYGESFEFENVSVNTLIRSACGPLALERYSLTPERDGMKSPARMGPFLYSTTMYVCRTDCSQRWRNLEDELNLIAQELSGPEARWGSSALARDGIVVRGMTRNATQVSRGLHCMWRAAKNAVWGRAARLPRRIY